MLQMRCRRCGLTLRFRSRSLAVEHCPRCLAWAKVAVPVDVSDEPPDDVHPDGESNRVARIAR
jgi:phage FluMu protein Com